MRQGYSVAKRALVWHENATGYIFCTENAVGEQKRGAVYRLLRRRGHRQGRGASERQEHGSPPI